MSGDKRIGGQLLPSGRNGGRTKNYSQRFTQRIGRRVKPQSGGRFGQGAATAGNVRLGNFRKRPDQQREGLKSKNKINFLAKANNNIRQVVNKPNEIQMKKDTEIQEAGIQLQTKNKRIRSRVPSL